MVRRAPQREVTVGQTPTDPSLETKRCRCVCYSVCVSLTLFFFLCCFDNKKNPTKTILNLFFFSSSFPHSLNLFSFHFPLSATLFWTISFFFSCSYPNPIDLYISQDTFYCTRYTTLRMLHTILFRIAATAAEGSDSTPMNIVLSNLAGSASILCWFIVFTP